jgi:tRNA(Ile2) C34 agmatinyltransferase TiaS
MLSGMIIGLAIGTLLGFAGPRVWRGRNRASPWCPDCGGTTDVSCVGGSVNLYCPRCKLVVAPPESRFMRFP